MQGAGRFLNGYAPFGFNLIYFTCDSRFAVVPQSTSPSLNAEEKQAILAELSRVLDSPEFHASQRCRDFLRHIVEHTLEGATEALKERNIGVDVFHRSPSYEPNSDAIVRVRATEVRKRLGQFYDRAGNGSGIRIVLAAGSYVPEFRKNPVEEPPALRQPDAGSNRGRTWWAVALGILALVAGYLYFRTPPSALADFWQPTLHSPKPVVICLGQPVVYHLSRRLHERYRQTLPPDRPPGPYIIPLKPGDIEASDILPVPDQYVGAGSAQAAARLSALLAGWKKASQIRIGNDFSFYDLRNSPAVLEGAFSNEWTLKLSQRMPFVFLQEKGVRGIRERVAPHLSWNLPALGADGKTTEDFAVVARVFDSGTMEPLVMVAGITQYGTQAAGELIANEEAFAAAMEKAPADWRSRNLQILLHVDILGKVPGKPQIIAVRTW